MNGNEIEAAKREARRARARLDSTMIALQQRLHPRALATEAWDGVREKSNDLAESAMGTVRERPAAVSLAVGATVLFLARDPLRRAIGRLFSKNGEVEGEGEGESEDLVTTRIDTTSENYHPTAPLVEAPPLTGATQ